MSRARPRILILGGYGTFGGRLARLLAEEPRLTLIIGGRSTEKATAFCRTLPAGAERRPAAVDRAGDIEAQIRPLELDLVVDASGPFQAYGAEPYRVVKACLALGLEYMDLADASGFVAGIGRFDAEAKARDVFVLSGASTFPALTAAALRHLAPGLVRVDAVRAGVAPSPRAPLGRSVVQAVAGCAGRPVAVFRDGEKAVGHALQDSLRYTIAPPGRLPLGSRRFALLDLPELLLLPQLQPGPRTVWAGAALAPEIVQRGLGALAWLVRLRLLPSLAFLAPLLHGALGRLRWGEHRGGMFVAVSGVDGEGRAVERSWHLLAEGDDGPFIPAMAAAAIVRRSLDGRRPMPGARPALSELELTDYSPFFERRAIVAGTREAFADTATPLYRRMLGEAWTSLPEPLRLMHDTAQTPAGVGIAEAERGTHPLSQAVAEMFRLPRAGRNLPVEVVFRSQDGAEIWERSFAGRTFRSVQAEGRGRWQHLLCERFGPVTVGLAPLAEGEKLRLVVRRWSLFGMPLPAALAPVGTVCESAETDGRFHFSAELCHPLLGLILRYRGWLVPRA